MTPPSVATLLAQAAPPSSGEIAACGPADRASALCRAIYRATGNEFFASAADTPMAKPAKVLLILALAFVVNRLMARAIRRFVRGSRTRSCNAASAPGATTRPLPPRTRSGPRAFARPSGSRRSGPCSWA